MNIKPRSPEDMAIYNDLRAEAAKERKLEKLVEEEEQTETVSDMADELFKKIMGGKL